MVARLLDPGRRDEFLSEVREDQETLREQHSTRRERPLRTLAEARARRPAIEWRAGDVPVPELTGRRELRGIPLAEIVPFIDWTFFFHAWEVRGKFPEVLDHPRHGAAARDLYANARAMLDELVAGGALTANAAYGLWPANAEGDDIVLYADASRSAELARFPMLRQQRVKADEKPQYCLADFVAPRDSGLPDHVGGFAVTAGIGADEIAAAYEGQHDDYSAIMVKALADRLAEALAEMLHARVRREWGYGRRRVAQQRGPDRGGVPRDPAGLRLPRLPRPPAQAPPLRAPRRRLGRHDPDRLLAMLPAASVSGIYLQHPAARYFAVGPVGADQAEDYAARMGLPLEEVERWIAPNLAYEPSAREGAAA